MKKIISVLLVFVMLFTLSPINITAEDGATSTFSDIKDTDYYAEAATELAKSDILSGYPDGSFGAEKSITRAEMAAIVCRMIDKEADSEKSKGKTNFDDVAGNHWASGYINIASKEGIINGYGNGKFEPESFVKVEEAIKMIVCALGFASNIEIDKNDWSKAYLDIAAEKGISDKIKGKKGEEATRGDIAVLSYSGMGAVKEEAKAESAAKGTPVPSIGEGTYTKSQKVTLSSKVDGATIYYTINGDTPTSKSKKYTKAITISKTTTLKAIAVKGGKILGDVMSVLYTINIKTSGGGGGGGGSSFGGGSSSGGASNPTAYTVAFDLNYTDAVNAPSAQNVTSGSKATKPANPERDGFLFLGWTTSVNGEELFDFNTSVTTNITLYAKWSAASKFYGAITGTYRGCNVQRGYVLYTIDEIYADEVLEQHSDITLGERTFKFADGIDPYKNLGVATVIYVCTNSEGKYEIVKMEANDIGKKETIDFRNIELSETNSSQIVYYPSSSSTHTNKIKLAPDAKFYDDYLTIQSMEKIMEVYNNYSFGYDEEITVIENNGDTLYDIVVANSSYYRVVTDIDVTKNKLNNLTLDFDDENSEITLIDNSGKKISLSDFKKGDVMTIVGVADSTDGFIWCEVVNYGRQTISGTVEETFGDVVYIDGKEYVNVSGERLKLGDEGTFYLTKTGKIFCIKLDKSQSENESDQNDDSDYVDNERAEYCKKKIEETQNKLNEVLMNRNVRVFSGGQWIYIHDVNKANEVQKELEYWISELDKCQPNDPEADNKNDDSFFEKDEMTGADINIGSDGCISSDAEAPSDGGWY